MLVNLVAVFQELVLLDDYEQLTLKDSKSNSEIQVLRGD